MRFSVLALLALTQSALALNGSIYDPVDGVWFGETKRYWLLGSIFNTDVLEYRFTFSSNSFCQVDCAEREYDSNGNLERLRNLKYVGTFSFSNEVVRVNVDVPRMHVPTRIDADFRACYSGFGRFLVTTNLGSTLILTGWRDARDKAIKAPTFTIERAIQIAKDYVNSQKIDVSQHVLARAECIPLRDENEENLWRIEWRLLDKTVKERVVIFVKSDGTATRVPDSSVIAPYWQH